MKTQKAKMIIFEDANETVYWTRLTREAFRSPIFSRRLSGVADSCEDVEEGFVLFNTCMFNVLRIWFLFCNTER